MIGIFSLIATASFVVTLTIHWHSFATDADTAYVNGIVLTMDDNDAARMSPVKSALERGLRFTIHSDTPVVPMEPLKLVWATVNSVSMGGVIIGEKQRISGMDALRATTINAAYQNFEEDVKGSIEVGKYADLVVLSEDPRLYPTKIKDILVLETIVGGRSVYRKGDDQ